MSDQPRDWDKELAEIDKLVAKGSTAGAVPVPATRAGGAPPVTRAGGRFSGLTTWLRVGLGLTLAVAITQWPYPSACGFNLFVYLGAISAVTVAGLWSSITSWQRRMGLAHVLSLLVLLWGLILAARELLPRMGYAAQPRTWTCVAGVEGP